MCAAFSTLKFIVGPTPANITDKMHDHDDYGYDYEGIGTCIVQFAW
jgi:hypothetical protein